MSGTRPDIALGELDDESLAALSSPGTLRRAAALSAEELSSEGSAERRFSVQGQTVVVGKGGIASARCSCPAGGSGKPCVHALAAALELRRRGAGESAPSGAGAPPKAASPMPAGATAAPAAAPVPGRSAPPEAAEDFLTFLDRVEVALDETLASGLAHAGSRVADRFASLAMTADDLGLYRVASSLREASGEASAIAERSAEADCAVLLGAMSRLLASIESARRAGPASRRSREYEEPESLRACPLGAFWWESKGGARGLTLALWEMDRGRLLRAAQARPNAHDPSFDRFRAWSALPFWAGGTSAERLCSGTIALEGARLSEEGRIASGGSTRVEIRSLPSFDALGDAGYSSWASLHAETAGSEAERGDPEELYLIRPAAKGRFGFDEIAQSLLWLPRDEGGSELLLELPYAGPSAARCERLISFLESGREPRGILVSRSILGPRARLSPVSVLVEEGGLCRPLSLDFERPPAKGRSIRELLAARKLASLRLCAKADPISRLTAEARLILESAAEMGVLPCGLEEARSELGASALALEDAGLALPARAMRNARASLESWEGASARRGEAGKRPRLAMLACELLLSRASRVFESESFRAACPKSGSDSRNAS